MAQNWGAPPPPPPPPGPPPPHAQGPMMHAQGSMMHAQGPMMQDKNAAYLAKMRGKQKQRSTFNPSGVPGQAISLSAPENQFQQKKISLFGDGFLDQAKIGRASTNKQDSTNPAKKAYSKYVQLPPTGLNEKQLFAKYRIESNAKIGQGAFARIKVVKSIHDDTKYALKMVKKKGKSRSDIEAFKKEILYLSMLTNHPNIIKMYDFCDSPQGLYMVLEYCNGGDVMQRMELVKVYKEDEAKHLVKQIVAGLCYFHQFNIVHRDLKLDNLMFNNNILKIIDFGLAGDCTDKPLNTPCGTIHFTAPEVLQSYDYTICADMWSLGVIIYLLLCGFPPFFDNQGNEQKLFQIIKRAKFSFIAMYFDQCDPCVKELITDLLKKRPIERLTAMEVRNHEWFTGIKQPRKKVALVPFLENTPSTNEAEYNNPFLNKKSEQKPLPPYMQQQQQQQQKKPPKFQQQQKEMKPQHVQPGAAPVQPGQPGQQQHYYYGQQQQQKGQGNYQQSGQQQPRQYGNYQHSAHPGPPPAPK